MPILYNNHLSGTRVNLHVSLNLLKNVEKSVSEEVNNQLDEDELEEDLTESEVDEDGAQHQRLRIRRYMPGRRIDKYLQHRFPDFSRTMIQRLIKEKAVQVNDKPTKCSYNINQDDVIDIMLPPLPSSEITPEEIPLNILYEDDHMMVLNKQADLIVHPARGYRGGTLVNGLVYYSDSLSSVNGEFRPGIVHRLDRNTTGVIIIAKTDTAHWRLAHQFEHRLTKKFYKAIVHGAFELDSDVINMPLGRHPKVREKYSVRADGKEAITVYEVKKRYRGYALVRLGLKTGRTHQLRVHMSASNHPIVADDMYGGKMMTISQLAEKQPMPVEGEPGAHLGDDEFIIQRQALHAAEITIRHPISGKEMTFEAPLPDDMQLVLDLLERYRSE